MEVGLATLEAPPVEKVQVRSKNTIKSQYKYFFLEIIMMDEMRDGISDEAVMQMQRCH